MTGDVTIQNAINSAQTTQSSTVQLAEDFSQFLSLLTVQLQNQDPLSPMETNEFTNQLVAFTGVEQQINTNQKLDDLVSLGLGTSFSASLNYVGLDVSYLSSETFFDGSNPVEFSYAVDGAPSVRRLIFMPKTASWFIRSKSVMTIRLRISHGTDRIKAAAQLNREPIPFRLMHWIQRDRHSKPLRLLRGMCAGSKRRTD